MEPEPIESETRSNGKRPFAGPRESLLLLGVGAGFFLLWMILFKNLHWASVAGVISLFIVGLRFCRGWAVLLIFATIFAFKFFESEVETIDTWDLLFTCVVMISAGLMFRYLELAKYIRAFHPALFESSANSSLNKASNVDWLPSTLGGRWWSIPTAVALAATVLWLIPYDEGSVEDFWMRPYAARMIFIALLLFFLWFVCRGCVSIAMRWKMTPDQAAVHARSLYAKEFWREHSSIESKRVKFQPRDDWH